MFTGIVQGLCPVVGLEDQDGVRHLDVELAGLADGLELGASVANNGVCLTVTSVAGGVVRFDVIAETMALTNLRHVAVGDSVNIERSLRFGDELGGHLVSGHVSGTMVVAAIDREEANRTLWFDVAGEHLDHLLWKGWVAIDGASLTISRVDRDERRIAVSLIPETIERTTLGSIGVGDLVNLEVDAQTQTIVHAVRTVLRQPEMLELLQWG